MEVTRRGKKCSIDEYETLIKAKVPSNRAELLVSIRVLSKDVHLPCSNTDRVSGHE